MALDIFNLEIKKKITIITSVEEEEKSTNRNKIIQIK